MTIGQLFEIANACGLAMAIQNRRDVENSYEERFVATGSQACLTPLGDHLYKKPLAVAKKHTQSV